MYELLAAYTKLLVRFVLEEKENRKESCSVCCVMYSCYRYFDEVIALTEFLMLDLQQIYQQSKLFPIQPL